LKIIQVFFFQPVELNATAVATAIDQLVLSTSSVDSKSERNAKSKAKLAITHLLAANLSPKAKIDSQNQSDFGNISSGSNNLATRYTLDKTSRSARTSTDKQEPGKAESSSSRKGLKRSRSHSSTASTSSNPKKFTKTASDTNYGAARGRTSSPPSRHISSHVSRIADSKSSAHPSDTLLPTSNAFYSIDQAPLKSTSPLQPAVPIKKTKYSTNKANRNLS
jgi:hypothetical protein